MPIFTNDIKTTAKSDEAYKYILSRVLSNTFGLRTTQKVEFYPASSKPLRSQKWWSKWISQQHQVKSSNLQITWQNQSFLFLASIWHGCFLNWWVFPPNHPWINSVFHDVHHPFWGTTILGTPHIPLWLEVFLSQGCWFWRYGTSPPQKKAPPLPRALAFTVLASVKDVMLAMLTWQVMFSYINIRS